MLFVNAFSNQVSGNATVAAETLANGGHFFGLALAAHRNSAALPAVRTVTNPTLFAIRRSNPDSGFAVFVNDQQRPLGFELENVAVTDSDGSQWVNHSEFGFVQDQFGSEPKRKDRAGGNGSDGQIKHNGGSIFAEENSLNNEQSVEKYRNTCPDEIGSGSESSAVFHALIIAGNSAAVEGN